MLVINHNAILQRKACPDVDVVKNNVDFLLFLLLLLHARYVVLK